jgi:hypothetical protein
MIKFFKLTFLLSLALNIGGLIILAGTPQAAAAASTKNPIDFQPQVSIPGSIFSNTAPTSGGTYDPNTKKTHSALLAQYIKAFYDYGLAIVGILAAIVLMGGGVLWLTSAGNDSKITQAKELIFGSIIGAIILFGSYIILNTINPDLLELKVISLTGIEKEAFAGVICCDPDKGGETYELTTKEDGTKYYRTGDKKGQKFTGCASATGLATSKECPNENYFCEKSYDTTFSTEGLFLTSYKCVQNDDMCCFCSVGLFGQPTSYTSCKNHVKTQGDCENFCSTWKSGYMTFFYPGTYDCSTDGRYYNWCLAPK